RLQHGGADLAGLAEKVMLRRQRPAAHREEERERRGHVGVVQASAHDVLLWAGRPRRTLCTRAAGTASYGRIARARAVIWRVRMRRARDAADHSWLLTAPLPPTSRPGARCSWTHPRM